MKRYEPEIRYEYEVVWAENVETKLGEWLKLEEVIEFIRTNEPSLLTDFYAQIDVKQ